jgi:GR25 family glycosyltransferase involved in LPS biosynthesis
MRLLMNTNDFGVAIVTYARSNQVRDSILKAISAGVQYILVWIDGPRNQLVARQQQATRNAIDLIRSEYPSVRIVVSHSRINSGAAASVLAASTFLFSKVSEGVVLEDDIHVDKEFFQNISTGIELSRNYPDIWMISGTRVFENDRDLCWDEVNYPVGWGWGTSSTKWQEIYLALSQKPTLRQIKGIRRRGFLRTGYKRAIEGFTDAWDTPLAAIMIAHNKKCLVPPVNLATNIGFDEYATHTTKISWPLGLARQPMPQQTDKASNPKKLAFNNAFYEKRIFKIGLRHIFAPKYDAILRILRVKKSKNLTQLITRVEDSLSSAEING